MQNTRKYQRSFFDLDYTLLPHDTLFLFAAFILRRKPWRIYYLIFFIPAIALYATGLLQAITLKQAYSSILARLTRSEVLELSATFARALRAHLFAEVLQEVESLKENGTVLFLNSASPQFYIEAIANELGFQHAIGTPFILPDRMPFFLKAGGPNNKSRLKLQYMRAVVPELKHYDSCKTTDIPVLPDSSAYSDSSTDLPLLQLAQDKYVIHPGRNLKAIAQKSDWTIWQPTRPYSSRLGQALLILRQMLGFYRI